MKTLLVSFCWLDEPDRIIRNLNWLKYIKNLQSDLGFTRIALLDNASSKDNLELLRPRIHNEAGELKFMFMEPGVLDVYRFDTHLPRMGNLEYPFCWRGLKYIKRFLKEYDKIVFMDTDFYVLSPKLAEFIKGLNTGWTTFYSQYYDFPECSCWVLCKDSFYLLDEFPIPTYTCYNGTPMEDLLPFTNIVTEFRGDRYGEFANKCIRLDADYYAQWEVGCPEMIFKRGDK